jgi:hypothetical protein
VLGQGTQALKWTRAVIQKIAQKIKAGTKFFVGHAETNSHTNRQSVGEVLASFVRDIGGKLSNIIIGHFPNKEKVNEMDVCSMEADIYADDDTVSDINDVTGIALGSSDKDSPAFPGALRLGMIQCFGESTSNDDGGSKMEITFHDVQKAVKELNIFPHQLFDLEVMKSDKVFGKLFTQNEVLKEQVENLTKEKEEIETKGKEIARNLDVKNAREQLDTHLDGLTDKQKAFITKRFNPDSLKDLTDKGIKEFVDSAKKDFTETAKLFNVETDETTVNKGNETDSASDSVEEEALKLMGVK